MLKITIILKNLSCGLGFSTWPKAAKTQALIKYSWAPYYLSTPSPFKDPSISISPQIWLKNKWTSRKRKHKLDFHFKANKAWSINKNLSAPFVFGRSEPQHQRTCSMFFKTHCIISESILFKDTEHIPCQTLIMEVSSSCTLSSHESYEFTP